MEQGKEILTAVDPSALAPLSTIVSHILQGNPYFTEANIESSSEICWKIQPQYVSIFEDFIVARRSVRLSCPKGQLRGSGSNLQRRTDKPH